MILLRMLIIVMEPKIIKENVIHLNFGQFIQLFKTYKLFIFHSKVFFIIILYIRTQYFQRL